MQSLSLLSRWLYAAIGLTAALLAAPAQAEWFKVSSDHFVIYGDGNERSMRKFADQLERYHDAMALLTGREEEGAPSPSNRVTIYLVRNSDKVREIMGGGKETRYVRGFYRPRAGRPIAVVPRITGEADDVFDPSMAILLHEYAHHFLIAANAFPMPRWANEGAAEFFASASFEDDGAVQVGRPNTRRGYELAYAQDVTAADLLDPESYEKRRGNSTAYDAFYGKSWTLYHYLSLDPARKGQLNDYYAALAAGKSVREAGLSAFGDFAALEKELDAYLKRKRLLSIRVDAKALNPGSITLRRLTAGEVAIMPVQVQSWSGVTSEQAAKLVVEARAIAARFPGDGAVLAALAEAEVDAGNNAEALAAADAAIKLDRSLVNAHVQKGLALFRVAEKGGDAAAFRMARNAWIDLNRLENDHPLPLIYFYRSYEAQGQGIPELASQGLARASELAPFDLGLRMHLAVHQLRKGQRAEARRNLVPVAFNPHGGGMSAVARKMIEQIGRDPDWRGQSIPAFGPDSGAEPDSAKGPDRPASRQAG